MTHALEEQLFVWDFIQCFKTGMALTCLLSKVSVKGQ